MQYTLTDLYNAPPIRIANLHQRLDEAIFAALPRAALRSRVDVHQRPPGAQARLSSHSCAMLSVVNTPLEASQAGGLPLRGTRSRSGHDHAISSSMSWSRRSSRLWMSAGLSLLRAHSRCPMRPSAKLAARGRQRSACAGSWPKPTTEKGSMTRGSPNPWLAPTRTARRTYTHARVEGATST